MKIQNILIFFLFIISTKVLALDPTKVTINRVTAPYFIVDGNSPATLTTAYVGFEIINNSNSGVTYSNLVFTVNSISTSVSGQNYSLVSPANGIKAVGTLAPGASRVCYYYVSYPASTTPQATFNITLSDATASSKTASFVIRNRSSISANAGGAATQTFTNQDLIGGTIMDDVVYTVGNVQNGDESDFQVAVSPQFDPTKMVLLSTKIIASSVPLINTNTTDSLYFITGNGGNGSTVTVRWTFRITGYNFTTSVLPCAGSTSGSTNYKYALNSSLGSGTPITVSASANPLTITKTSDQSTYLVNSIATFTINISNPGAYDVVIDKITDNIPAGFVYNAIAAMSDVTNINSTTVPASGSTALITFDGGVVSGANTSYRVPAGGSINLVYTATAPSFATADLTTTAKDFIATTEVGSANTTVRVVTILPVKISSFRGMKQQNTININWQTSEEINMQSFELQKMNAAGNFEMISHQAAKGVAALYDVTDVNPLSGNNYYRLKSISHDGHVDYSNVINIIFKINSLVLTSVYPNPFTDQINMSLLSEKDQLIATSLFDATGNLIKKQKAMYRKGNSNIKLKNLNTLADGIYFIRLSCELFNEQIKMIKK